MEEPMGIKPFDEDKEEIQISTLVFMDLEATGLPSFAGKKNVQITEMSFLAVDRYNFEVDKNLRVLNKLSICVRPRAVVSPGAMSITGLYNDMLEVQEKFDDSIPKLMEYFFRRLRRPLCLLAHNGNRYDFPLLQAELKNINYALDPQVLCADTLQAFRNIVLNPSVQPINMPIENDKTCSDKIIQGIPLNNTAKNKEESYDSEVEILLSQDMDLFTQIKEPINYFPITQSDELISNKTTNKQNFLADEHTPPKPINVNILPDPIHRKKAKLDPTWSPKNQYKANASTNFRHLHAKRQLFSDNNSKSDKNKTNLDIPHSKPVSFSLEKLYCHYFGENPPVSHYAEADCVALSKVCQKVNKDFLKWIDKNSTPFNKTVAMW